MNETLPAEIIFDSRIASYTWETHMCGVTRTALAARLVSSDQYSIITLTAQYVTHFIHQ